MQIYHYTHEGEYIGESVADLDPIENLPLIPAHATEIAPPAAVAGQVAVFNSGAWSLVADTRGDWYMPDQTKVEIKELSEVVPSTATRAMPPLTLEKTREARNAFIESAFQAANSDHISYMTFTFQADKGSIELMGQALTTLTALGGTQGIGWWDLSNVERQLTYAQFAGLCGTILARGNTLFANKRAKKDLIAAATTNEQVNAVTWA